MEQVTFEEASKELVSQLEELLGKLALAADSGLSTYQLEGEAKKLTKKLKESASLLNIAPLYKEVKGNNIYPPTNELSKDLFPRYANLCKKCGDQLSVSKEDGEYFAKITEGLFIKLSDLPFIPMPTFKVKIEGNTIMAIRNDLYEKLPSEVKELVKGDS